MLYPGRNLTCDTALRPISQRPLLFEDRLYQWILLASVATETGLHHKQVSSGFVICQGEVLSVIRREEARLGLGTSVQSAGSNRPNRSSLPDRRRDSLLPDSREVSAIKISRIVRPSGRQDQSSRSDRSPYYR